MALSRQEHERIRAVQHELRTLRTGAPSALDTVLPALRELVGASSMISLQLRFGDRHLEPHQVRGDRVPTAPLEVGLRRLLAHSGPAEWTGWNPVRPAPSQRNRAVGVLGWLGAERMRALPVHRQVFARAGLGPHDQLRVLLCEGPALLCCLAAFREEPFTPRDEALWAPVLADLQRRASLEGALETTGLGFRALGAALEEIASPAFLLRAKGAVAQANAAGALLLDRALTQTLDDLRQAVKGRTDRYRLTPLAGPGLPTHYLAVALAPSASPAARVEQARRRYGLSPRQTQVLGLVMTGLTNRGIAGQLGCSDKTVELHVSALLARTGTARRAELVARVLQLPE
jgi:DNA-binding CsgD family transcriptional regulator